MSHQGLTKFERIRLVRRLGLNTQNDILVTCDVAWQRNLEWLKQFDRYTVRSFREGPLVGVEPYFAIIGATDFEKHRRPLLADGWQLIIAEGIDPKDAFLAGTILREGEVTEVDIVRGSGSVTRQVTHDGQIDDHFVVNGEDFTGDKFVDEAISKIRELERCRQHLSFLKKVIYEFSYYQPKVGYKRENAIFWEITGFDKMSDLGIDPEELK